MKWDLAAARLPSVNKALKLSFRLPSAATIASVGSKSFIALLNDSLGCLAEKQSLLSAE